MNLPKRFAQGAKLAIIMTNYRNLRTCYTAVKSREMQPTGECPICNFEGHFEMGGTLTPRMNAVCPGCHSLERHRLMKLAMNSGQVSFSGKKILHFAPEPAVRRLVVQNNPLEYLTADIDPAKAMRSLNIEGIDLPDNSYDTIICSHVLEHVDHHKALSELHRVLAPKGVAILLFPIVEAWANTYEDARFSGTPEDRAAHFGQDDHIKFFGRDIRDHIRAAGFHLEEFVANGPDSARHALMRGETIFLAMKHT